MTKVLLEENTVPFHTISVGKVVYDKAEIRNMPFTLYQKLNKMDWLRDKTYHVTRETRMHHTPNEWIGTEYLVSYHIEFDNAKDALEFNIRFNN